MKSEIRIIGTKTKIIITLGLSLSLALILSMFLFPLAWQILLFTITGAMGVYIIGNGLIWIAGIDHQLKMMSIERNQKRYMSIAHTNHVLDASNGKLIVRATRLTKEDDIIEGNYQPIEPRKNALDLIQSGYHFLMVGDTGSGKSTLAAHFINQIGIKNTIVCDPHAQLNDWPQGVKVVQDYQSIASVLARTFALYKKRIDSGERNANLVLLAIDELPDIVDELAELNYKVGPIIKRIARGGRKVNICLLIMSQGENVGDLDLKGFGNVKKNFVKILTTRKDTLQNIAKVVYSNGDNEIVNLHGPLHFERQVTTLSLPSPKQESDLTNSQIETIRQMKQSGESYRAISQAVWGNGKFGTHYNEQIDNILRVRD